ncbi:VOC family protein [Micromonospora auratinigra]|uniref:VOC family protein n=1 Tax=Micromonospora auratinigra TaxID=261654 RepID=UPI002F91A1B9
MDVSGISRRGSQRGAAPRSGQAPSATRRATDIPESIIDPAGRGPRVWFQQVPEPKVAKNRWHFDLKVGGGRDVPLDVRAQRVKATAERLVKAGATLLRIKDEPDMGLYAAAMQDPEGNEFDVV